MVTDISLWVLLAAASLHVVEEHALGWQGWATGAFGPKLGLAPSWADFWVTNACLIVFGLSAAVVGWAGPAFALAFPALCLINALGFHVVPSVAAKRPNPGLFTAVLLYLPLSIWAYVEANDAGVLSTSTVIGSVVIGGAVMAAAIGMLALSAHLAYPDAATLERELTVHPSHSG